MSDTKILSAEEQVSILERAACTSHAAMKDAQAFADSHAAQEQRIAELESCIDKQEREHTRTMEQRDQFEERIGEIGSSLGLLEYDLEWSNLNDVGERCVQRANELVSQVDSACVVINAFKGFQMLMDGKIDESTFNSIIKRAEADMARAAEWLNEYVNTAVEQLASTEERNKSIREELEQAQGQRDAALQRAEVAEAKFAEAKHLLELVDAAACLLDLIPFVESRLCSPVDSQPEYSGEENTLDRRLPCRHDYCREFYPKLERARRLLNYDHKLGYRYKFEQSQDLLRQIREALPAERAREIADLLGSRTDYLSPPCKQLRAYAALVEEKP